MNPEQTSKLLASLDKKFETAQSESKCLCKPFIREMAKSFRGGYHRGMNTKGEN